MEGKWRGKGREWEMEERGKEGNGLMGERGRNRYNEMDFRKE